MHKVKQVIAIALVVVAIIVALQNMDQVNTKLLFITFAMPRFVLLLIVFALGFIAGKLSSFRWKSEKE